MRLTGEVRAGSGQSLTFTGSANTNAGRINLLGGELEFTQNLTNSFGGLVSGNGSLITHTGLLNQGTMNFGGTTNILGDVTNAAGGKIISAGGGATIFFDDVTNQGEIRTSTNGFSVFFGTVSGAGTFTGTGTVNFEGDLTPGNSPASVQFGGDVAFGSAASLKIELAGSTPGAQYDQVHVTGQLSLDGELDLSLLGTYMPAVGTTFDILDWGSLAGTFFSLQLPTLTTGIWDTSQLYTTGMLSVVGALAGDYNHNGVVDAADYVVWRKGLGTTYTQNDYDVWRANFGRTAGGGSGAAATAAVPEPTTLDAADVCGGRLESPARPARIESPINSSTRGIHQQPTVKKRFRWQQSCLLRRPRLTPSPGLPNLNSAIAFWHRNGVPETQLLGWA